MTSGGTPSRKNEKFYSGNIPWVKSGELDKGLILDTEEKITEEAIKNSSAKIFPRGTLLIALYGATIGKLAFLGIDAATNQAVCGIFLNKKINSSYLFNFLSFKKSELVSQGIGGAQPNISQGILKNLKIPLPPLPEQQQIVAKIEELFSELENGKKELLIAQAKLKTYRQSLLKWAFEGRLTNKNLKEGELPKGWEVKKLGEVCKKVEAIKRKEKNPEEEFFYLDIGGIDNETNKILNHKFYHWKDAPSRAQQIVFVGDVLFSTVRTYMKNIALVKNKRFHGQIASSGFCVIRANEKIVNSEYIFYYSLSQKFLQPLNELQTGSSYPAVRDKDVFLQPISFPQIKEQQKIVAILESKLTICDAIEETIKTSIKQGEALRQSILKKAFEGQLIAPKIQESLESNYKNKESKK